eukprot:Nk52_evm37s1810 gene=Nk52_evmTU37s1810
MGVENCLNGRLKVKVIRAEGLKAMDLNGFSDPYVVISVDGVVRVKTKYKTKTLNPEWNQYFLVRLDLVDKIEFIVYDHDYMTSDDLCGFVRVLNEEFLEGKKCQKWFDLSPQGRLLLEYEFEKAELDSVHKETDRRRTLVELESSCPFRRVTEDYRLLKTIGKGGFSVVINGLKKSTGRQVAIKVIDKSKAGDKALYLTLKEIRLQLQCKHPNIVRVEDYFQDHDNFYIVMELLKGGELFHEIVKRKFYSERDASVVMQQLLDSIEFMHHKGVVHRDIKPENLLLEDEDCGSVLKIADFGLAFDIENPPPLGSISGTPAYMAPEMIAKKEYGELIDEWACGVVLYILLCGYPPFWSDSRQKLFSSIEYGLFEFDSPAWDDVTAEAKDLVSSLLQVDPKKRLTAKEALKHPWIMNEDVPASIQRSSTISKLEQFNAQRKFKGAVSAVLQVRRMANLVASAKAAATVHEVKISPRTRSKYVENVITAKEEAKKKIEGVLASNRAVKYDGQNLNMFFLVTGLLCSVFFLPTLSYFAECLERGPLLANVAKCLFETGYEQMQANDLSLAFSYSWLLLFGTVISFMLMEMGRQACPSKLILYCTVTCGYFIGVSPAFLLLCSLYDVGPKNVSGKIGYVQVFYRRMAVINLSAIVLFVSSFPAIRNSNGLLFIAGVILVVVCPLILVSLVAYDKNWNGIGAKHIPKADRPFVFLFYGLSIAINGPFVWHSIARGLAWSNIEYLSVYVHSFWSFRSENVVLSFFLTDIALFTLCLCFITFKYHGMRMCTGITLISIVLSPGFALSSYLLLREMAISDFASKKQ